EQPAIVEPDGEPLEPQLAERGVHHRHALGVGQRAGGAHDVRVALGELAEAPLGGAVGAPDRRHLIAAEGEPDLRVHRHDPGQRHREVVAQRLVALAALAPSPRLRILKMSFWPSSPYFPVSVSMRSKAGVSSGSKAKRSKTWRIRSSTA